MENEIRYLFLCEFVDFRFVSEEYICIVCDLS